MYDGDPDKKAYYERATELFYQYYADYFEVYMFEGPGQGGVMRLQGMHFTYEWEKPVKAVLDFFKLDNVNGTEDALGQSRTFPDTVKLTFDKYVYTSYSIITYDNVQE